MVWNMSSNNVSGAGKKRALTRELSETQVVHLMTVRHVGQNRAKGPGGIHSRNVEMFTQLYGLDPSWKEYDDFIIQQILKNFRQKDRVPVGIVVSGKDLSESKKIQLRSVHNVGFQVAGDTVQAAASTTSCSRNSFA